MKRIGFFSFGVCAGAASLLIGLLTAADLLTGSAYNVPGQLRYSVAMFFGGLVPIIGFYLSMHSRLQTRTDIPSDSEIDSMYYLGFLITLVTLISTVISTAVAAFRHPVQTPVFGEQTTLVAVSFAFALSLAATAISLFFRINLVAAKEEVRRDPSLEDAEARVSDMILRADLAYSQLLSSIDNTLHQFQALSDGQRRILETDIRDATKMFRDELASSLQALASEIGSSGLTESMQAVTSSFRQGGGELAEIIKSLGPIPRRISAISSRLEDVASEADSVHEGAASLRSSVREVALKFDAVPADRLARDLVQLRDYLDTLGGTLSKADALIASGSSASAASLNRTTQELEEVSTKLGAAFARLASELEKSATVIAEDLHGDQA